MKCLSCQAKGKHFENKICPPCVGDGVSKDDIKATNHKKVFTGENCGEEATKLVNELRSSGRNISRLRQRFISHKYDITQNQSIVSWVEYEGGKNGEGKKAGTDKSK